MTSQAVADDQTNWAAIGGSIAAAAIAVGGLIAGASGVFSKRAGARRRALDSDDAQRAKASRERTAQTVDGGFKLVEQLQEERAALLKHARAQTAQIRMLEQQIRDLTQHQERSP